MNSFGEKNKAVYISRATLTLEKIICGLVNFTITWNRQEWQQPGQDSALRLEKHGNGEKMETEGKEIGLALGQTQSKRLNCDSQITP